MTRRALFRLSMFNLALVCPCDGRLLVLEAQAQTLAASDLKAHHAEQCLTLHAWLFKA